MVKKKKNNKNWSIYIIIGAIVMLFLLFGKTGSDSRSADVNNPNCEIEPLKEACSLDGTESIWGITNFSCTSGKQYYLGNGYPDFWSQENRVKYYRCPLIVGSSCSDDDGGSNIVTFGSVRTADGRFDDECHNTTHVKEWYCSTEGLAVFHVRECGGSISLCEDGYCRTTQPSGTAEPACTDSDDGYDFGESGYITMTNYSGHYTESDECLDEDTLLEYVCVLGKGSSKEKDCSEGCKFGACIGGGGISFDMSNTTKIILGVIVAVVLLLLLFKRKRE